MKPKQPETQQPPVQNFFQEPPSESLVWMDGARSISLNSCTKNIDHLAEIAEKFIPLNNKNKLNPDYTK